MVLLADADKSSKVPGLVKFGVTGKKGSYVVTPSKLPPTALLVLAPPAAATPQCAGASFPGPSPAPSCAFTSSSSLKCK
jgi:hypothetical protein